MDYFLLQFKVFWSLLFLQMKSPAFKSEEIRSFKPRWSSVITKGFTRSSSLGTRWKPKLKLFQTNLSLEGKKMSLFWTSLTLYRGRQRQYLVLKRRWQKKGWRWQRTRCPGTLAGRTDLVGTKTSLRATFRKRCHTEEKEKEPKNKNDTRLTPGTVMGTAATLIWTLQMTETSSPKVTPSGHVIISHLSELLPFFLDTVYLKK